MLNPLSFISKIFKSSNDIELAKFRKILEKINSFFEKVDLRTFLDKLSTVKYNLNQILIAK